MPVNQDRRRGVQSVHRALDLLELLSDKEDRGVTELAEEAGLAVSTAHNLLRTLTDRGYLTCRRGSYRLGPEGTALGAHTDPARLLTPLVGPALKRLGEGSGHSAVATALVGTDARLIGYAPGAGAATVNQTEMMWRDPLAMATGRILVAARDERDWDRFLTAERTEDAPAWPLSRWHEELRRTQSSGYAVRFNISAESTADAIRITGAGVPVHDANHAVACAIGVAVPTLLRADGVNAILDHLWPVARDLSRQLGYDGDHVKPRATAERLAGLSED